MGIQTANRVGTWASRIPAGTIVDVRFGEQFFGRENRPALQLRVDGTLRTRHAITLSFSTAAERDRVWFAVERSLAIGRSRAA